MNTNKTDFSKYTTCRKYDGCHPIIADALQQKNPVYLLCLVWNENKEHAQLFYIVDYEDRGYKTRYGISFDNAEPKKKGRAIYVRNREFIEGWLKARGCVVCDNGCSSNCNICYAECPMFNSNMFYYCSKKLPSDGFGFLWHPDWLIEKEDETTPDSYIVRDE